MAFYDSKVYLEKKNEFQSWCKKADEFVLQKGKEVFDNLKLTVVVCSGVSLAGYGEGTA